ncbi:MAG TPA: AI-2E family transporter [Gammaproteobacteria bacterium]|nr:AI-2E family transporter [Gammaproteobacteria bacterium]
MNKFFIVFLAGIFFTLLYFLAPVLTPFMMGMLLAYLVNPLVNLLMRLHLPRIVAVMIVFAVLFLVLGLLIVLVVPLIQAQLAHLADATPDMIAWVQDTAVPLLKERLGHQEIINVATLKEQLSQNWVKAGGAASWVVETLVHSGFKLLHWLFDILLIFVVTFYLLYDWQKVVSGIKDLLPKKYKPTVIKLAGECNEVLGAFFRGQLLVMLTLGMYYSIVLSLVGLQIGIVIGILVGVLTIIPYLGAIIGILTASIAAYIQFGSLEAIVPVWIVFAIGQTMDGMFVTPKLVGDRIGLHPVVVIFAVLSGGVLFGFFGVLLALPVASVIMVLLRFLNKRYHGSLLYQ